MRKSNLSSTSTSFFNRVDSVIGKIDQTFNANNLLTGRYYFGDSNQSFPFAQLSGGLLPGFNTVTPTRVQLVAISYVKVVNSRQVNEARLGWNRFAEGFFPEDQAFNPNSIGLDTGVGAYDGGLPAINFDGALSSESSFSQIGATASIPRNRVDSNWHFVDDYSWKSGKHEVKFGYEFRRTTINQVIDHNFRGTLSFSDLSSFLQGIPDGGAQVTGNSQRHTYQNSDGLFIQDSFRATPRLTLNYGVRWDYFGVTGEKDGLFYTFNPANGGSNDQTNQLYGKDFNNFAPRLAFAYDMTGKGTTVIRGGWGLFYDAFSQDMFLGHLPWNCVFCPGPAYPGLGTQALATGSASGPFAAGTPVYSGYGPEGDFFSVDPNMRTPYIQNFNLNLQQQIGSKNVLQIGYVGSRGTKLFQFLDINQPSQAQITAADLACVPDHTADPPVYCPSGYGVPRTVAPNFFYLNQEKSSANSSYHALQVSLRTNGWHGLTSQANYVWSHSIDTASDLEDFEPNQAQPQNSTNPAGDRGNSSFDIRRRFTWNFTYQLPKMGGSMQRLKNGWGLDGVLNLQNGQPWQLNYEFEGDYSGAGEGFDRPDQISTPQYSPGNPLQYLNMTSFAAPCTWGNPQGNDGSADETNCVPGTRHFGNLGRNSLKGPSFKEFNFSVFKDTNLSEHVVLTLRAEFFNLFNHPNFSNPLLPNFIGDAGSPDALTGQHTGYYSLQATGDVGIGNPFLGGGGPRGVQFAAKITF